MANVRKKSFQNPSNEEIILQKNIKNIKITDFAKRHFDPKFGGTKITDMSVEEFELKLNSELNLYYGIREGRNFLEITSDIKA